MLRPNVRGASIAVVSACVAVLAACNDAGVAPRNDSLAGPALPSLAVASGSTQTVTTFRVSPNDSGTYDIAGGHQIFIPAGAICDIETSSYGETEWDQPCVPETDTVTITATSWTNPYGRPVVDFQPALRFSPADTVMLYLTDWHAPSDTQAEIYYCASNCVDESVADSSQATQPDLQQYILYRRIKHFSGYNIAAGVIPQ